MIVAVLTSLLMVVLYVGIAIIATRKIPESFSSMVFILPKCGQWIWTVWLILCALPVCIGFIEKLPEYFKVFGFATMVCIGFTAVMPLYMKEQYKAHKMFAIGSGIFSQVCVSIIGPCWLIPWALLPIILVIQRVGWKVGITAVCLSEIVCTATGYGVLIF